MKYSSSGVIPNMSSMTTGTGDRLALFLILNNSLLPGKNICIAKKILSNLYYGILSGI